MQHHISLGSTPPEEACAQVGADNYYEQAKKECNAYKAQLMRLVVKEFGVLPDDTTFRLRVRGQEHDYGTYYEVFAFFSEYDAKASEMAFWLDANIPGQWDEQAKKDLGLE